MSTKGRAARLELTKFNLGLETAKWIEQEKGNQFPQRRWFEAFGSQIYLRHCLMPLGDQLDIATVTIRTENQRQGIFTYVLGQLEQSCFLHKYWSIKVENVMHPGLERFLINRGYYADKEMQATDPMHSYRWGIWRGPPKI